MDRDVDGALEYFAVSSRNRYRQIFTALQDSLPDKASSMEEIELVYSMGNVAKYRIGRDQLIDGVIQKITYYIHFAKDEGIWFIDDF